MKKKILAIVLSLCLVAPNAHAGFADGGAFGSVKNYLKRVGTSIVPSTTDTYNLGSASKVFANVYATAVNATNWVVVSGGYVGLGAAKGRIVFTDATVDLINFLTTAVKIGAGTPTQTQAADDLYVTGKMEVDGKTWLDGDVTWTSSATGTVLLEADATRTGTNPALDIDATINTTTASDNIAAVTIDVTRTGDTGNTSAWRSNVIGAATNTGNIGSIYASTRSGDMANGKWAYGVAATIDTSECTTATSNSAALWVDAPVAVDAQCNDYGAFISDGYDIGLAVEGDPVQMGDSDSNAGAFSMIQGAVASDPTFSITQATNDVTIAQTVGDITLNAAGNNVGIGVDDDACGLDIHSSGALTVYEASDDFSASANCKDGAAEWLFNDDVNIGGAADAENLYVHNGGTIQALSAGDDKNIQISHDDTDAQIVVSSGDANIKALDDIILTPDSAGADTITFAGNGTDLYQMWSDGSLYLASSEPNADSIVVINGNGSGEAQLTLVDGTTATITTTLELTDTTVDMDFGSSITAFVVNEDSANVDTRIETGEDANAFVVNSDAVAANEYAQVSLPLFVVGEDKAGGTANDAGSIKLFSVGDNAYYNTFTAGTNTANATYTLPVAMPAVSGYALTCTDAGVMSWAAAAGIPQSEPATGNMFVGTDAGKDLTTGDYNVFLGIEAGEEITESPSNVAVGYQAGGGTAAAAGTGTGLNTCVGYQAGQKLQTGAHNILLGDNAGDNITTGSTNLIIASNVDADSATASGQMNIGNTLKATGIDGNAPLATLPSLQNVHHEIGVYLNDLTAPKAIVGLTGTMAAASTETSYEDASGLTWTYTGSEVADKIVQGNTYVGDFDGADMFLQTPDTADLTFDDGGGGKASWGGWVQIVADTVEQEIITKWNAGGTEREWAVGISAGELLFIKFCDESEAGDPIPYRITDYALSAGWHFFVIVGDFANGAGATQMNNVTIYVDGGVVVSTASNEAGYVGMANQTAAPTIGADYAGNYWKGDIGRLFVTGEALTAAQVWKLYEKTRGYYNQ